MRLFVALALPGRIRRRLSGLTGGVPGVRWTPPENYHLTLRFIGEVGRHQARDIDTALRDVEAPGFSLRISGVGGFARRGRLRALWAGVDPEGALTHLQSKVERACQSAAMPPGGRKFKPHVTLARAKDAPETAADGFLSGNAGLRTPFFEVGGFHLYESTLGGEGAHYEAIAEYPLQALVR